MDITDVIERPGWLIGSGLLVQLIGMGMALSAWSARANLAVLGSGAGHDKRGELFGGAFLIWIGFWIALIGVIIVVARFLALGHARTTLPTQVRWRPGPPQLDPTDVAADPRPFIRHEADSQVVADVRRACGRGVRRSAVQRIITTAAREGRLTDHDRVMAQALIDEADQRPLAPLAPDDFL